MTSQRHFNGVAHDIAHHAQSGLSYVHPYVVEATRRAGAAEAQLDLLGEQPWPPELIVEEPLRLATGALREKFREMVDRAGLSVEALGSANLSFRPVAGKDAYCTEVQSLLVTRDGRRFEHHISMNW